MLAKLADALPAGDGLLYEPKWDGFRAVVFRGGSDVFIQSRDSRPLDRYFPDLHAAFLAALPDDCIVDGEIVIATPTVSISMRSSCAFIPRRRAWRSWRGRRRRRSWRSI